jgi:hypothetical protein
MFGLPATKARKHDRGRQVAVGLLLILWSLYESLRTGNGHGYI